MTEGFSLMSKDDIKVIEASLRMLIALARKHHKEEAALEAATILKLVEASHAQARL